jgi:hypothetical protein
VLSSSRFVVFLGVPAVTCRCCCLCLSVPPLRGEYLNDSLLPLCALRLLPYLVALCRWREHSRLRWCRWVFGVLGARTPGLPSQLLPEAMLWRWPFSTAPLCCQSSCWQPGLLFVVGACPRDAGAPPRSWRASTVVVVMKSALHSHLFSLRFFLHLDLSVDGGAYAVCLGTA